MPETKLVSDLALGCESRGRNGDCTQEGHRRGHPHGMPVTGCVGGLSSHLSSQPPSPPKWTGKPAREHLPQLLDGSGVLVADGRGPPAGGSVPSVSHLARGLLMTSDACVASNNNFQL